MTKLAFYFTSKEEFDNLKLSISENDDKYVLGKNISNVYIGKPNVPYGYIIVIQGEKKIWTHGEFVSDYADLSNCVTKTEADQSYVIKSSNEKTALIVKDNGQIDNFGNNGQAFNAIRDVTYTDVGGIRTDYLLETGSKYPINCASYGVRLDGNAAFSHKKYDKYTYDKTTNTATATGAKNTAILSFSGNLGLMYAKNTGTSSDVTAEMYRKVGVIDSPDTEQKVYSASQSDAQMNTLIESALIPIVTNFNDQINELKNRIEDLENQNVDLYSKVELLLQKCNVTEDELNNTNKSSRGLIGGSMIDVIQKETDDILFNLKENINKSVLNVTTDYSKLGNIVDENMSDV